MWPRRRRLLSHANGSLSLFGNAFLSLSSFPGRHEHPISTISRLEWNLTVFCSISRKAESSSPLTASLSYAITSKAHTSGTPLNEIAWSILMTVTQGTGLFYMNTTGYHVALVSPKTNLWTVFWCWLGYTSNTSLVSDARPALWMWCIAGVKLKYSLAYINRRSLSCDDASLPSHCSSTFVLCQHYVWFVRSCCKLWDSRWDNLTYRFGNRLARATGSDTRHWKINYVKASMRQMKSWKNFALLQKKFEIFCARRYNQLQQNKEIVRIIPLTINSDTHLLTHL